MKPSILTTVLTKQLDNLKIPKWKSVNEYIFLSEVEKMEEEKVLIDDAGILVFNNDHGWAHAFYESGLFIRNITDNLQKAGWKSCSNRSELN